MTKKIKKIGIAETPAVASGEFDRKVKVVSQNVIPLSIPTSHRPKAIINHDLGLLQIGTDVSLSAGSSNELEKLLKAPKYKKVKNRLRAAMIKVGTNIFEPLK